MSVKKVKTSNAPQNAREIETDANKEMKERIEGILKVDERKTEYKGEISEEAEEEELNSDDDVSGTFSRL